MAETNNEAAQAVSISPEQIAQLEEIHAKGWWSTEEAMCFFEAATALLSAARENEALRAALSNGYVPATITGELMAQRDAARAEVESLKAALEPFEKLKKALWVERLALEIAPFSFFEDAKGLKLAWLEEGDEDDFVGLTLGDFRQLTSALQGATAPGQEATSSPQAGRGEGDANG